ncbi:hypothetical protein E2C01_063287 [Portunus trituberculatus]|uniref:Uncharacterized protein n=1 Tax=Portunus trituberculatus TaxID=210409 RepID=A0A5B7HD98_PORTR|nr:hypothetical protein [Portunus trituberculatus]
MPSSYRPCIVSPVTILSMLSPLCTFPITFPYLTFVSPTALRSVPFTAASLYLSPRSLLANPQCLHLKPSLPSPGESLDSANVARVTLLIFANAAS